MADTWVDIALASDLPVGANPTQAFTGSTVNGVATTFMRSDAAIAWGTIGVDLAMNSHKFTGLADPSNPQDSATKAYVDSVATGLDVKASVRVATTVAGTLATSFENGDSIDGVTLATNDRILIKDQAAPAENGIYVVAASGAPTRATDMNAWTEVPGAFTFIEEGTTNGDTGWVCTSDTGGVLNTTAITFVQFSSASAVVADEATITKVGNTFSIKAGGVGTTELAGDAVTFAKMQNLTTDRLMGRDTAGSGDPEEISVGGGLEFTGSSGIQRSALTGDVTASAGSNSTTIANNAVTDAKFRAGSARSVVGVTANSGGNVADIQAEAALGSTLRYNGSTLSFGPTILKSYAQGSEPASATNVPVSSIIWNSTTTRPRILVST